METTLVGGRPADQRCRSIGAYELLSIISEGTYGAVSKARNSQTGHVVAVKRLKIDSHVEGFPITSLREVNSLLRLSHENVVKLIEICTGEEALPCGLSDDSFYIVMEFVDRDLKEVMDHMDSPFRNAEAKYLLQQLFSGLAYIHSRWIIHRDIKPSNLLLSTRGVLKIADFGLAREYCRPIHAYSPLVATLNYRAPELLLGAPMYGTEIDIWSAGCIFGELLLHRLVFTGRSELDQIIQIFDLIGTPTQENWPTHARLPHLQRFEFPFNKGKLPKTFDFLTDCGFVLLSELLALDPLKRITAAKALQHPYLLEDPMPVHPDLFPGFPARNTLLEMTRSYLEAQAPAAPFEDLILDQYGSSSRNNFNHTQFMKKK